MFTPFRGIRGIPEVIDDVMGGVPQYEKGKLNIGKSKKKVKNRKQAIAIALNEAGIKQKRRQT